MRAGNRKFFRHVFDGGWATDLGGKARARIQEGEIGIPYLLDVDNSVYKLEGGLDKPGGTAKLNSSAFESGADVMGMYDYWIEGTGGSPTQHRIAHVGTKIKKDDGDESFSDLFTGLDSGAVPSYSQLDDLLIMSSDSTADVPKSWDGSTAQNLAGSPPNFSFSVVHGGRVWASGDASNPGKVYYSSYLNPENWSGTGSGEFNIDPQDGSRVTALASYKGLLWIFKGPYKGSIHYIQGSAPTGSDAFRHRPFIAGVGAVANNAIFPFLDDLGFLWQGGQVYTINNLADSGLFNARNIFYPISGYLRKSLKWSALNTACSVNVLEHGLVLIGLNTLASSQNDLIIGFDYRWKVPRLLKWSSFTDMATSMMLMIDPDDSKRQTLVLGGNDGFMRKAFRTTKTLDTGDTINQRFTTPFLDYGSATHTKTLVAAGVGSQVVGNTSVIFEWQRDGNAFQSETFSLLSGAAELATSPNGNDFVLGTSALGGDQFVHKFRDLEEGGEFNNIRYRLSNNTANQTVDLDDFSVEIEIGGTDYSG